MTTPLYEAYGRILYPDDVATALAQSGVQGGDTIFVHSDVAAFGKPKTRTPNLLFEGLLDALRAAVTEAGTVIMPTFTYGFCKGEPFDLENSPSTVGVLTEYFRNQGGVVRTAHPIFSVAIWGRHKDRFLNVGADSFGPDSIFAHLHRHHAKTVVLGSPFGRSCTFVHYVEQACRVPYRYFKTFTGPVRINGHTHDDTCTFFVRRLDIDAVLDVSRLEQHLLENGCMTCVPLGAGRIMTIECDLFFKEASGLLKQDSCFLLADTSSLSESR